MRSVGSLGRKPAGDWKRLVPLKATGRVGGQAWKESAESDRKESGAKASTSKTNDDPYGDADEQYWQDKTIEETGRFEQQKIAAAQVTGSEVEQLRSRAQARSWEVLGGLCVAVAMGVSGYSLWERAEYERALQVRQADKISATVEVAKPMPQAPRDWSPWQVLPLSLALLISLFCKRPQAARDAPPMGPLQESSGLALRVHKLEAEFDSGTKTVRHLARQLEKLGVRFRLSRRTLRDPLQENTDAIETTKFELQIINARLLRMEEGLFEAQEIMLAMQEQQAKQFAVLAAALPKVAAAHRRFVGQAAGVKPKPSNPETKPSDSGPKKSGASGSVKAVQKKMESKAGQILGSIRVPYVGKPESSAESGSKRERGSSMNDASALVSRKGSSQPAKPCSTQNGVPRKEGPKFSTGKLVGTDADPLKVLSALDAESLVKDVEVPERYVEDQAMFEAFKNSLVDRKIDLPRGFQ